MGRLGEPRDVWSGATLDDFPSYIAAAHELKSPLVLMRQLSLMLEDGGLDDNEQKRMLRQISLTSERALRLTSDLTRTARLDGELFGLEPINPVVLCEEIVRELSPLFTARDRELRLISRHHAPHLILANRDLLRRVIMNFSDNALNYADEYSSIDIIISSLDYGSSVRLGVRDYGPAVPAGMIKSIDKDKLMHSRNLVQARPQSSGLGIFIASQFAKAMNGKIGVTKHRDGATFYIDLQTSHQLSLL
ncbi:HAMP domain-containing histidine kinase [Candidatus Saccharibacteria bacterium]|nr:HAMP domain-containing histidine kinase [Candidatus Saccharibacteria bacterium]